MLQDIRFAFRSFAKNPVFAAIAVLTVALGVGPNSAIFSIVNAVLLKPLPYRDPDRIVMLWETNKARGFGQMPVSAANLADWKRDSRSFEEMAPAFTISEYGFNVTAGGEPERAQAGQAAANFFDVLGAKPVIGRFFLPEEDRPGGNPVVLISYGFWERRFAGSPSIIGRQIGLDGVSRTVVGVLPKEVSSLGAVDLWIPIALDLSVQPREDHHYGILARLKPGVTPAQAQAELDGIAKRLERQYPATNAGMGVLLVPMSQMLSGAMRPALLVLEAAVLVLLLIACANVASLLLARGAARQQEIAVRAAIGAGRGRIVRQLLTESVILSTAGGALGVVLATWSIHALRAQLPDIPLIQRLKEMGVDWRVLAFTVLLSLITGVIFGLAPAWRASRTDLNSTLRDGGRGVAGDGSQRLRTALLAGEVALAMVLLAGASLMLRSFMRVTSLDPGFRADHVLTMQVNLPKVRYREPVNVSNFVRTMLRRVEALPGVRSAAVINILPARTPLISLRTFATPFRVEGEPAPPQGQEPMADYRVISPQFLDAMRIPLRAGRTFNEQDTPDRPIPLLVNETMARRYLHGDAVGRRLRVPGLTDAPLQIVGVVGDVKMQSLESNIEPAIYLPFEQAPTRQFSLMVRSDSDPAKLAAAVRREILSVDPDQPVADVRTMEDVLSDAVLVRRLSIWMLGTFALLALSLAIVGIYGLTSYSVSRRTHEIGVRVALGAGRSHVIRLVVWQGMLTAMAGVALGLPCAFYVTGMMRSMLFGVTAGDPLTYLLVPVALIGAAAVASYVPARRALRIDPMTALRYQ